MNKKRSWSFLVVGVGAVLLAACTTTQQAKVEQSDIKCGFLGPVCSQLRPGAEGQIAWRYLNPAVNWAKYTKLMLQPVTYWDDQQSKVSVENQHRLTNFLYAAFEQELAGGVRIAKRAAARIGGHTHALQLGRDPRRRLPGGAVAALRVLPVHDPGGGGTGSRRSMRDALRKNFLSGFGARRSTPRASSRVTISSTRVRAYHL